MEGLLQLLPLLLIFAVFYFLVIRPQQNRQRRQQELVRSVAVADRIVTIGGLHGTVESVADDTMRLEIAPGTVITMAKAAVARKLVDADTGDLGDAPGR